MSSLRARRNPSPLPPFGTDADLDPSSPRGRSAAGQPSRVREPSMKEIFSSPVETPQPRGRSRGPPGGASTFSFGGGGSGSDSLSVPSFGAGARSRSPSRTGGLGGDAAWNVSGGMAGVMGSSAATPASRSRSRGAALGVSSQSPFATSGVPPVPAIPAARATSPPLPTTAAAAAAAATARSDSPPYQHVRKDSAFSSVVSPSSPVRAYSSATSRSDYASTMAPSVLAPPTDISSSLFTDPEVFRKVEAKMMDFKQKLASANAKIDKRTRLRKQVTPIHRDPSRARHHKLSIDNHASTLRIQSLESDLTAERRARQSERVQFAAEKSALTAQVRGDASSRSAAERDLEAVRADHAKVAGERDELRAEVASLTANMALAQREIADLKRRLEVAGHERERREMAWNESEKQRLDWRQRWRGWL
ncbi:hypothetical protein BCR44DRAFT_1503370 [Catenaria anguillulae PL171]|uniref:Uncharacterized protein n=1 Tax=Catenaria anguillulae PL171 TaxID=765915 RepID=A0A1Y2HAZ3_9FUNG|nr:hypothetical protein BCR44DRAFT_1503370 [Catenaria anguillulae PL171]